LWSCCSTINDTRKYVVVDMTAGADAFASGLFTRFDRTFLICEPTRKAVAVQRQYREYSADFGVALSVIGNKVTDRADVEFLRREVGEELLACFTLSPAVRAMEQGDRLEIENLEPANRQVLNRMQETVDATVRDPARFLAQMHEIHLRNAKAWANAAVGIDLATQIDPDFRFGPQVIPLAGNTADGGDLLEYAARNSHSITCPEPSTKKGKDDDDLYR